MLLSLRPTGIRYPVNRALHIPSVTCRRSVNAMAKDALAEADKAGAFKRTDATFRSQVAPGAEFEPEGTFASPVASCCHASKSIEIVDPLIVAYPAFPLRLHRHLRAVLAGHDWMHQYGVKRTGPVQRSVCTNNTSIRSLYT